MDEEKPSFWIKDNRILLSILFGISGTVFLLLFLDSHYKKLSPQTTIPQTSIGELLKEIKDSLKNINPKQ